MKRMSNVTVSTAQEYVDDFLPTLSNFCSKSPLNITIKYVKDLQKVFLNYNDKTIEVDIDINVNKKDIIRDIKKQLRNDYPVIYEKVVKVPDADEIERLMRSGMSLTEALNSTAYESEPKFRVMRKHDRFNELDLYSLKDRKLYKYKSKIPVTALLKMIECGDDDVMNSLTVMYQIENDGYKGNNNSGEQR